MRPFSRLVSLWNTLFRKHALDQELDEEIRSAVDLLADRYVAQGMRPDDAKRAAEAEFGGVAGIAQTKGDVRDSRIGSGIDTLLMDVRFAWRGIRRAPGLTAVAVVTLALGIGANTAIFSVVRAMLIQPLPYRDANRLTFIWLGASRAGPVSGPDFRELRTTNTMFADLAGIWASGTIALTEDAEPEALRASFVTTNFFQLLGVDAAYGRTFRPEDGAPGAPPAILLAWDLFQRRYGGDPSIVGRTIMVSDAPTIVIGVMPRTFRLLLPLDSGVPDHLQVWQPLWPQFEQGPRGNQFLRIVGRMKPGVTVAQARADVDAIARRIVGRQGVDVAFTTVGLQADAVREIRGPLLALFAGVGLLLMIACVNVGSLLVARAVSRSTDIAVRLTLGASHGRLVTQSLVEGSFLVAMGAMAGIAAGFAGLRLLPLFAPESLSRINVSRIDVTVLTYTVGVSVVWGLLFSLAPMTEVLRLSRTPQVGLGGAGAAHASTRVRYRTRASLVIAQVALSVVLLVAAGLLVRAFVTVLNVDRGFKADNRMTFRVALNGNRYPTTEQVLNADTAFRRRDGGRRPEQFAVRRSAELGNHVRTQRFAGAGRNTARDHTCHLSWFVRNFGRPPDRGPLLHRPRAAQHPHHHRRRDDGEPAVARAKCRRAAPQHRSGRADRTGNRCRRRSASPVEELHRRRPPADFHFVSHMAAKPDGVRAAIGSRAGGPSCGCSRGRRVCRSTSADLRRPVAGCLR
jgi:putative ABC transport system permease protein